MAINETLKFSWGHIIAFVAMIFISYVSFMGLTYITGGSFILAGVGSFVVDVLLVIIFIVPQLLKGTEHHFSRHILWERIIMAVSIPVFLVAMLPFFHFWTVFSKRDSIESGFKSAVIKTEKMFEAYEKYSSDRINSYKLSLRNISQVAKNNRVEALQLQLSDENYLSLKEEAVTWINRAKGVTVWNVFMIGNLDVINTALGSWNESLFSFSNKMMTNERAIPFTEDHESVVVAKRQLMRLRNEFVQMDYPSWISYILVAVLYLLLLVPYLLQSRNTKSSYVLLGSKKGYSTEGFSRKKIDVSSDEGGSGYDIIEL